MDRGEPARARGAVAAVDALTQAQLERIDASPANDPQLRSSRPARPRAIPEAVAAPGLVAALAATIHGRRSRQLVGEGAVALARMQG